MSTPTTQPMTDERFLASTGLRLDGYDHKNHTRIAHEFAADNIDRFLNVFNMGWPAWSGERWVPDTGQAQNALMSTLRRLRSKAYDLMAQELQGTPEPGYGIDGRDLLGLVQACESASGLAGVLKIASVLPGMTTTVTELDADASLLNMPSGTLDLRNGEVRPHEPADRITKITRGSYAPAASPRSDLWEQFLEMVLPDPEVRDYFRRFVGLSLLGKVKEHVFTIAHGTGRNGKGVAYTAVSYMLGDYAGVAEDGLFEVQRGNNAQAASPALAKLRGVRWLVVSETEERARIAAAFMKRMTGGDRITARELYGHPFEFDPSHTILMVTNHLPKLPANDPATWARTRVIPFTVTVPDGQQDKDLPEKLREHVDAVLHWAVEGYFDYAVNGLGEPAAVEQATQAYADSQDDVRRFVEAQCLAAPNGGRTTTVLHSAYAAWAANEGIHQAHVLGLTKFGQQLDNLGFPATRTSSGASRGLVIDPSAT